MPIGQVNFHSAKTEEVFERLAWFFTTAKQMTFFDADGYPHKISNLIHLSRGCIPFPLARMYTIPEELCAKVQL